MKIQLVSDTHEDISRFQVNKDVDLVLHAGDFTKSDIASIEHMEAFVVKCSEEGVECAFVLGNHDYYGHDFYNSSLVKECYERGYNLIDIYKPFVYKDYTFIGGLFGTDFKLPFDQYKDVEFTKAYCKHNILDFYRIYSDASKDSFITPKDYLKLYNKYLEYIKLYENKENIVLVTHFPVSSVCLDPKYKNNPLNPYFINDIDLSGFKNVVSGHTHLTNSFKKDNVNIYINASGYTSQNYSQVECPEFDPNFIIEV